MLWFLHRTDRLNRETAAIADLERDAEWLSEIVWLFEESLLCLDAVIKAHGYRYPVRMRFPTVFPMSPPTLVPRKTKERWSGHQFGPGGELCLEWGPDNWEPEVDGAEILKSAFKLLRAENPRGGTAVKAVPSRHSLTLGQELRRAGLRFCIPSGIVHWVSHLQPGAVEEVEICVVSQRESFLAFICNAGSTEETKWIADTSPEVLKDSGRRTSGLLVKTSLPGDLPPMGQRSDVKTFLNQHGYKLPTRTSKTANDLDLIVFSHADDQLALIWILDNDSCMLFRTIHVDLDGVSHRHSPEFEKLGEKRVGVVGLGSVGSKLALSLGRSGVRRFVLVDDDIFLPENLSRHTLDWRNIGEHKVDGVARQLELLAPRVEITTHKIRLSGQESTGTVASAFASLATCDLVIDATADPRTFNQLAAVVHQYGIAFIWMEVFAGGVGGLIARHRPRRDPTPHAMRSLFNQALAENETPIDQPTGSYAAIGENDRVMVACDADIGVIANHSARMAIDAMLERELSIFPHSIYLIGLARSWLFKAPFYTIPIALDEAASGAALEEELSDEARAQANAFLEKTIEATNA